MKKAIQISIPEPCHEDWAKMTPTQKGRHCASCEKEVTDYTKKTDEELVKLLSNAGTNCGRFKKSQINREVTLERKSTQALAPYAASLLIPLSLMSSLNTKASTTEIKIESTFKSIGIGRMSEGLKTKIIISGFVVDSSGNPLSNVKVYNEETENKVLTNSSGYFEINSTINETIKFEKSGFISEIFKTLSTSSKISITLSKVVTIKEHTLTEHTIMGGMRGPTEIPVEIETMGDIMIEQDAIVPNHKLIKGTVTDSSGLPLPGVNIIERGTTNGTRSDFDGNYSINISLGKTLVYSYVGFEREDRKITENSNGFNITMQEGETLTEVVMTGGYNVYSCGSSFTVSKYYGNEAAVEKRKSSYKNTLAFLKLKIERKKEARKAKRAERKAAREARKK